MKLFPARFRCREGFRAEAKAKRKLRRISGEIEILELGEGEREWRKSYRFYEGE